MRALKERQAKLCRTVIRRSWSTPKTPALLARKILRDFPGRELSPLYTEILKWGVRPQTDPPDGRANVIEVVEEFER